MSKAGAGIRPVFCQRIAVFAVRWRFLALIVSFFALAFATPASANAFPSTSWSKAFSAASVEQGGTVSLTFTIDNTASVVDVKGLGFTDDLGAMMSGLVSTSGTQTGFCGGSSSISGTSTLTATGISVAAGASCTFTVTLQVPSSASAGDYVNETSYLATGDFCNDGCPAYMVGEVFADLTVTAASFVKPSWSKSFSPSSVEAGGTTTLTFTIDNTGSATDATDVEFTDDLDAMMSGAVSTSEMLSGFCGSGSKLSGTSTITVTGVTVSAGETCTFSVTVEIPNSADAGSYTNTTGRLSGMTTKAFTVARVTANLTVTDGSTGKPTWSKSFSPSNVAPGETTTLLFTIDNSDNDSEARNVAFTDDLDAALSGLKSTSGTVSDFCGEGSRISGTSTLSASGIFVDAGETCTFSVTLKVPGSAETGTYINKTSRLTGRAVSSSDSSGSGADHAAVARNFSVARVTANLTIGSPNTVVISREIEDFLQYHGLLVINTEPDRRRRIARLQAQDSPEPEPVPEIDPDLAPPGSKEAAGLRYAQMLAEAAHQAAISASYGSPSVELELFGPPKDGVDFWLEGQAAAFGPSLSSGYFGVLYGGLDFLATPDVLVGGMFRVHGVEQFAVGTTPAAAATGLEVGPYLTARLSDELFLDARILVGGSTNAINPLGTSVEHFSTLNWEVSAALQGEFQVGEIFIEPEIRLSYFEQVQQGFTANSGGFVPQQAVGIGEGAIGTGLRYRLLETEDIAIELRPRVLILGNLALTNGVGGFSGLRGRAELNTDVLFSEGAQLEFGISYDGWGPGSFQALGGRFKLAVPLD